MANLKTSGLRQLLFQASWPKVMWLLLEPPTWRHPTSPVSARGANLRPGRRSSERRARGMAAGARIPWLVGTLAGAPPPWSGRPEHARRSISVDEVRQALIALPGGAEAGAPVPTRRPVTPAELPAGADARRGGARFACCSRTTEKPTSCSPAARRICVSQRGVFSRGRLQPGEPPLHAALRETKEEIGIDAGAVEVIGELTPLTTTAARPSCTAPLRRSPRRRGGESLAFAFDPGGVEKVFWVPLAGLAVEGIYHEGCPGPAPENDGGTVFRVCFRLEDDVVWGAAGC